MARKYSKSDISVMKEALYNDMCPDDRFCTDCPYQGHTCPDNLEDDMIIEQYEKRFGHYAPAFKG